MTMEPISSVMSVQAQAYVPPVKPVEAAEKMSPDSSTATQAAENVDQTTGVVENAKPKNESQNQEDRQKAFQNETEQIKKALEQMKKNLPNSEAVFGVHEGTHRVTIKLIDKKTKEVIKELPPEKTLDMIAKVWEMAGILVDEKR